MLFFYLLVFLLACVVLVRSGTLTVRSLTRIAQFLEWKEFVAAAILMAFVTSLPEFFVGLSSGFHHKPQLSFGNIIGANIINLTLVIGIGVWLAKELRFEGRVLQRSSLFAGICALLPLLLMLDGKISRIDGIVLLLALIFYFQRLIRQEERFTRIFSNKFKREWSQFKLFLRELGLFLFGVGLLLLSAEIIVRSASALAIELNFPLVLIGLLLVSLGTTLPEITFGIKSIALGHRELILGNTLGSVVVNSTLILGMVALISPFEIPNFSPYFTGIIFTLTTVLLFSLFIRTGQLVTRKEALILFSIYLLFVLAELFLK